LLIENWESAARRALKRHSPPLERPPPKLLDELDPLEPEEPDDEDDPEPIVQVSSSRDALPRLPPADFSLPFPRSDWRHQSLPPFTHPSANIPIASGASTQSVGLKNGTSVRTPSTMNSPKNGVVTSEGGPSFEPSTAARSSAVSV